jgi:phosphoglycolate phosphatase-like HAD superfamily hydrolase
MALVLFDVDGTLLHCGDQVRRLLAVTLEEIYGTRGPIEGYDFAGKTDPQIVLELMTAAGLTPTQVWAGMAELRRRFHRRMEDGLRAEAMVLLPGVRELLGRLAGRLVVGLLTGNWEATARLKLDRLGLDGFFPFGGFGEDGPDRRDLVPAALDRAARFTGRRFAPQEVLVVGDTVHDVTCARAHGLACLAVTIGRTPAATLRQAGARWVTESLAASGVPGFWDPPEAAGSGRPPRRV